MTVSPAADLDRAEVLVRRALLASPRRPLVHLAKGMLLHARGDPEQAIPEYETVIASNRNWVNVLYTLGMCRLLVGSIEETTPLVEQAIRFSPRDPFIANWYMLIGTVDLLKSRTDEAIRWLEKALSANTGLAFAHGHLAAAHALNGDAERAAAELAEARRLSGDGRFCEHRPIAGRPIVGSAKDPRPLRNHLFRRAAQGRNARRIDADGSRAA
jgi:tetratricopeptide (TPR) repeat protein